VGRRVRLGRGVYINVVKGGHLEIGDDVHVDSHAQLTAEGELMIGANTYVGSGTIIAASGSMTIGRDVLIAAYCTIRDQDHRVDQFERPYRLQGLTHSPVRIGNNVWVGTKATVLRGVSIGEGAVIGANAVVTSDVEANWLSAGVPAKPVKKVR
jgi:acetyltransferase-like isoleucine patch superfamily enzyme